MEYSNLLNLYVASTQLHSSLDFDEVIERVRAIVLNIIGAVVFAMYLADERGDTYPIVLREGGSDLPAEIVAGQGRAGKAIAAREMDCVAAGRALAPAAGEPIACVPLEVGGEAVGVLVIHELLAHKSAFDPVDLDLLRLLQTHAAGALFAAHAYASAQRRSEVIDGLLGDVREQFERLPR